MRFSDIIVAKRDAVELSRAQISFLVDSVTDPELPAEQIGALLMAIYLNGMSTEETIHLTRCMRDSGTGLTWTENSRVVDKHSTGGVGDKVSLPLTPMLAACGVKVPMISGRGLEHTGGTTDKLESIPGYEVNLTPAEIMRVVEEVGCSLTTQTSDMIPADGILYAMRDVTNTVASIPLIVASIMSKKLAEGIGSLLLDIKVGSAAFMRDVDSARELAHAMIAVGTSMGVETTAMLSTMDAPLGRMVGNSLEIVESVELLSGSGPDDLLELVIEQAARLLSMCGAAPDSAAGRAQAEATIHDRSALARFEHMLTAQGVEERLAASICTDPRGTLEPAPLQTQLLAISSGNVAGIDAMLVAQQVIALGGGRTIRGAAIDHRVGVELHVSTGDAIERGQPWVTIHHTSQNEEHDMLERAIQIIDGEVETKSRIIELI